MSVAIVWFRRDLRLGDNTALGQALEDGAKIVPVYVHAPAEDGAWAPGSAARWWLQQSLGALGRELEKRGSRLLRLRGPSHEILPNLARATGASAVHWNRLYEPSALARDGIVADTLVAAGIEARPADGQLLFAPESIRTGKGGPYRVFTPFYRVCRERLASLAAPRPAPRRIPDGTAGLASLTADELCVSRPAAWQAGLAAQWQPGERAAQKMLARFVDGSMADYHRDRDRPDRSGSSRLSPYLHFGELSPRQVIAAVLASGKSDSAGADSFLRELGWREFAHYLLYHFPHTTDLALDERFSRLPWRQDPALLRAWQQGRTGIPLVDAGMRELWRTGWMHNRVRMVVASLLTKNLFMHWLEGARWFWDTLVDADLANNTLGWQWTAGCGADAAPYFRILNPVLQAEKFDPQREYIRRWVPELAALPDRWIHQPWAAPAKVLSEAGIALGRDYPPPLVDLASSRAAALERFARLSQR